MPDRPLTDKEAEAQLKAHLGDQLWRLCNLYWITNKKAERIQFRPNWAQRDQIMEMHYRNLILKARQFGFTTFWQIWALDQCLFNKNTQVGVIAHTVLDAEDIFRTKIKFAYENLPEALKAAIPAKKNDAGQLILGNNSSIRVSTSMRSGTVHLLHVSEIGKIAAKYPDKAMEIVSGALEAVPIDGVVVFESTAEGRSGVFYDYVMRAFKHKQSGKPLGPLDFKLHFYPWFKNPNYALQPPADWFVPNDDEEYFRQLRAEHGIRLSLSQKHWYCKKKGTLSEMVYREYPSYIEEAFFASVKGSFFRKEMTEARLSQRITSVPHDPYLLVDTWWDLGVNDENVIWFTQDAGREIHVIDFYMNANEGLTHYIDFLREKTQKDKYRYGRHVAPHDIRVREYTTGTSRWETARDLGITFEICPRQKQPDQVQAVRRKLPLCWFDEKLCEKGITGIEDYKREYDEVRQTFSDRQVHDKASHVAKAFMTFAVAHDPSRAGGNNPGRREIQRATSAAWTE